MLNITGLHFASLVCMYIDISLQCTPRINKRKSVLSTNFSNLIGFPPNFYFGLTLRQNSKAKLKLGDTCTDYNKLRRNHEINKIGSNVLRTESVNVF